MAEFQIDLVGTVLSDHLEEVLLEEAKVNGWDQGKRHQEGKERARGVLLWLVG